MDNTNTDSWTSRKLFITILAMLLIVIGGILTIKYLVFGPMYSLYIGGILGAMGLYHGGNISERFLTNKVNAQVKMAQINSDSNTSETEEEVGDNNNGE